MHNVSEPIQIHDLKSVLEATGRLWWIEERVNAFNEEMATDAAFIKGAKQGVIEQINRWAERDGRITPYVNKPASDALFQGLLDAKFPAVEDEEPLESEEEEAEDN